MFLNKPLTAVVNDENLISHCIRDDIREECPNRCPQGLIIFSNDPSLGNKDADDNFSVKETLVGNDNVSTEETSVAGDNETLVLIANSYGEVKGPSITVRFLDINNSYKSHVNAYYTFGESYCDIVMRIIESLNPFDDSDIEYHAVYITGRRIDINTPIDRLMSYFDLRVAED